MGPPTRFPADEGYNRAMGPHSNKPPLPHQFWVWSIGCAVVALFAISLTPAIARASWSAFAWWERGLEVATKIAFGWSAVFALLQIASPKFRLTRQSMLPCLLGAAVTTSVLAWCTWEYTYVRQRRVVLSLLQYRGMAFATPDSGVPLHKGKRIPLTWRVLGANPVSEIQISNEPRVQFWQRIAEIFPEASVTVMDMPSPNE